VAETVNVPVTQSVHDVKRRLVWLVKHREFIAAYLQAHQTVWNWIQ